MKHTVHSTGVIEKATDTSLQKFPWMATPTLLSYIRHTILTTITSTYHLHWTMHNKSFIGSDTVVVYWRVQAQLMALRDESTTDMITLIVIQWLLISFKEPYTHIQFIIRKLPKLWCHQRVDH